MFIVYVLKNETSDKIYIGVTKNFEVRIKRHNGELFSSKRSYTRNNKGKWVLVYKEEFKHRSQAILREKYLKSHIGRDWIRNKILGP